MPQRTRAQRFAAVVAFTVAVTATAGWSSLSAPAARARKQPNQTVVARITRGTNSAVATPLYLSLVPATVKIGTVLVVIRNLDRTEAHRVSVNNVSSPSIRPGAKAAMKVTLKRAGKYIVQTNLTLAESGGSAILQVSK